MKVLSVYLRIYARAFRETFAAIGRNPWTLLLPGAVLLVRDLVAALVLPLGFLAGIVDALAAAALFSGYLFFLHELVQGGRVSLRDIRASLGAYLWSIVNVYFVFWVALLVLQLVVGQSPNATAVLLALWIVALVAFNAVPEVIYNRGTYGGLQTVSVSWEFLKEQWMPWFAANVPLLAPFVLIELYVRRSIPQILVVGALLHVVMVFRGHLFRALDGSSHRRRMFEQRLS